MTQNETMSGVWRKRAVASVGVAAAVAAGSVALASSANAAAIPQPTLTLSAPTRVLDNGTNGAAQLLTISASNSGSGAVSQSGPLSVTFTGVPTGVICSNIMLTGGGTSAPAFVATSAAQSPAGTCVLTSSTSATIPVTTGTNTTDFTYNLAVNSTTPTSTTPVTGTLSETASLNVTNTPGNTATSTSNTATTQLVDSSAPTVAGTAPAATIYRPYSFQLFNTGFPTGTVTVTDTTTPATTSTAGACPDDAMGNATPKTCYPLNNGLVFNATTGKIVSTTIPAATARVVDTYTIKEDNTTTTGTGGTTGSATATVNIPVLFSDVPATGTFSDAIYTLSAPANNVINGFLDGTFRPTTAVTRDQFAHFIYTASFQSSGPNAQFPADGACDASTSPSPFSDVPNNSQFCTSIRVLASYGIVNGFNDGKFHPSAAVTRGQIAAFIYRNAQIQATGSTDSDAKCTTPTGFNDVTSSTLFCGDIEYLVNHGYAKGFSDGGFHPSATALRQEVAQIVYLATSAA